jgi:hypothetical protein
MSRWIFILLVATISSCTTLPRLSREEQWAYFEDWDVDDDTKLNADEFGRGYMESGFFHTWAGKRKSLKASELTEKLQGTTNKMRRSVSLSLAQDTIASTKSEEINNDAVPAFVDRADENNDGIVTDQEWARVMYLLADENSDRVVSPLEFYLWQLLRG